MSFVTENFLIICVLSNTLILALEGYFTDDSVFVIMNTVFTAIFAVEMTLKLYGLGIDKYCQDAFNIFDGIVVILSFVEIIIDRVTAHENLTINTDDPTMSNGGTSAISAFRAIRIFRTFRVLRVSRLLRGLRFMKVIVEVIGGCIEQFTYISMLLFLMIFIVSLLGMKFFGGKFADFNQAYVRQNFDTFHNAFLTIFQILT